MAAWWEEEGVFAEQAAPEAAPVEEAAPEAAGPKWWEQGAFPPEEPVTLAESAAAATPFPMEPGESRAAQEVGEAFVPEFISALDPGAPEDPAGGGVGATLGATNAGLVATAALTMTDPNEIAQMLRQFPEIGITYAPDGTILATNNETGARGVINRPGVSAMDVVQMLGLTAALWPAGSLVTSGRVALKDIATKKGISTAQRRALRKQARNQAAIRMGGAAAGTEAVIQTGQQLAGGTFDPIDIAISGLTGAVPDVAADPLLAAGARLKDVVKPLTEAVPKGIRAAVKYAKETGKDISTSDALWNVLTPIQQTIFNTMKRIPIVGTGKQQSEKQIQRMALLEDLVEEFDLDMSTELGKEIADSIVRRLIKTKFFGMNKNPSLTQIEEGFKREATQVESQTLSKFLRKAGTEVDEDLVTKVLDSARPFQLKELWDRLDDVGRDAARRRVLGNGLAEAGWDAANPQAANPAKFLKYLDKPKTKAAMDVFFEGEDAERLLGMKEWLRLTGKAGRTAEDAGTSLAAAAAVWAFAPIVAPIGKYAVETGPARQLFLKLHHAKGKPELEQQIMEQLRPVLAALGRQFAQTEAVARETFSLKPRKSEREETRMQQLRGVAGQYAEDIGGIDITGRLKGLLGVE